MEIAERLAASPVRKRAVATRALGGLCGGDLGAGYLRIWAATAVSELGNGVRLTALPLLTATVTRDPGAVAGVALMGGLPWILCSLFSGALVDRLDRRIVMVRVDLIRAVLLGLLAGTVALGAANLAVLYSVSFALGLAETFFDNAAHAILPAVVSQHRLERANGRLTMATLAGSDFVGPMLGGLLFASVAAAPFLLDGVTFLIGSALLLALRGNFRPARSSRAPAGSLVADIREGLTWLRSHRPLLAISVLTCLVNIVLNAGYLSLFVLYALEILGLSGVGFGILLSAYAVGGLSGSAIAPFIARRAGKRHTLAGAIFVAGLAYLTIGVTSSVALTGLMVALLGGAGAVWSVVTTSIRQSIVPDRLLGRVNSAHRFVSWSAIAIGPVIGGVLSHTAGLRAPFLVGAVVLMLTALVALATFRRLPSG